VLQPSDMGAAILDSTRPYLPHTSVGGSIFQMGHFSKWATLAYGARPISEGPNPRDYPIEILVHLIYIVFTFKNNNLKL
jgi:hypothetical protein